MNETCYFYVLKLKVFYYKILQADAPPPMPSAPTHPAGDQKNHPSHKGMLQKRFTIDEEQVGTYFRQEQKLSAVPAATHLEHLCSLNINETPHLVRKTGIICTLGTQIKLFQRKFCHR